MTERPLIQLLKYAQDYRPKVFVATLYSIINKLFDIAPEILIGIAIDVVVSKEDSFISSFGITDPWHQILFLAFLTFLIWVGESFFEYLYLIAWRGLAQNLQHDLRIDTYQHIQNLDLHYFEDKSTGNLVSILNDDVNQLERFLDGGANQLIQTFTAVVGVGSVFFFISPSVAAFSFLPIPFVIFGAFYFQSKATPLYSAVRDMVGHLASRLNNNITGIMTIKSFTAEAFELNHLKNQSQAYLDANKKAIAVSSAFIPVIRMAILAGFLVTFILGASKVFSGDLGVGSYGVLVFLTQRLLWPLTGLAATIDLYERAMASTRRILSLLKTPIEITSGDQNVSPLKSSLQLKNLSFKYNTGPLILKNLDIEIPVGKTTAFVGSTGSGKSTLVKLLLRFYDPTQGEVLWDGNSLRETSTDSLRKQIALVSQDVFLFHGTVQENIAYALSSSNKESVIDAAKKAEAHDFIMALPEQYDTIIGERGQKLSGGQRQRLSIARALLKNPDILILDEATSAVDNETEAAIQRSLEQITQGRTTIVIAHRLSTIVNADGIYVLENGEAVQKGTHHDLIQEPGTYRQLWSVQTGTKTTPAQNQLSDH